MPPKRKSIVKEAALIPRSLLPVPETKYKEGDVVMCLYSGAFYEAKIMHIDAEAGFFIHYQGWNKRYDGYIPFNDYERRFRDVGEPGKIAKKPSVAKTPKSKAKLVAKRETSAAGSASKANLSKDTSFKVKGTPKIENSAKTAKSTPILKRPEHNSTSEKQKISQQVETTSIFGHLLTPESAQVILEDNSMIIERHRLPKLPTKATYCDQKDIHIPKVEVFMDLEDTENMATPPSLSRSACVVGILNLFDASVSRTLLYPFEQEHLNTLLEKEGQGKNDHEIVRLSQYLGVTYLFRLFVRFHDILKISGISKDRTETVLDTCNDIAQFAASKINAYFDPLHYYIEAPLDYIQKNTLLASVSN